MNERMVMGHNNCGWIMYCIWENVTISPMTHFFLFIDLLIHWNLTSFLSTGFDKEVSIFKQTKMIISFDKEFIHRSWVRFSLNHLHQLWIIHSVKGVLWLTNLVFHERHKKRETNLLFNVFVMTTHTHPLFILLLWNKCASSFCTLLRFFPLTNVMTDSFKTFYCLSKRQSSSS